jgi:leader peptidase (prepilin peptidase)/N-methyltransferase
VTPAWIALAAVLGLFAGAAIWNLALARAAGWAAVRGAGSWLPILGAVRPATHSATPPRALLFQLGVALYYALLVVRHGEDPGWVVSVMLFTVPLLILLLVDAWTRLIHTNVIAAGVLLGLVSATFEGFPELGQAVAGGLVALAIFGLFYVLTGLLAERGRPVPFGLGDVYLAAMIGVMVRFDRVFFALFAGLALAGLAGIVLLLGRRHSSRQPLSFGPYLCAGALLALAI